MEDLFEVGPSRLGLGGSRSAIAFLISVLISFLSLPCATSGAGLQAQCLLSAERGHSYPMPLGILHPHPGGMADNSPTFQRWDHDNEEPTPEGTAEIDFPQPSLRDSSSRTSNPTLKR